MSSDVTFGEDDEDGSETGAGGEDGGDAAGVTVPLGEISPAGTRHMWQRSAVAFANDLAVVGSPPGRLRAFDADSSAGQRWATDLPDEYVVSLASAPERPLVAVGCRGESGVVAAVDADTGDVRWSYRTADDVGAPQKDSLFFLPYVVDVAADGDRIYAAARRYERAGGADSEGSVRSFHSAVYAFDDEGAVAWTYRADASPIALDLRDGRLAVAYNRCTGDHQCGLVVLDADTGDVRLTWDPGLGRAGRAEGRSASEASAPETPGQRRVGDASLLSDGGVAVASHGDYRGYRLDERGGIEWSVDLARPRQVGEETLYAYPNHVYATDERVAFVTGNTYPEEGREADGRHPNEHAVAAFSPDGRERWRSSVEGWVSELAGDGSHLVAPCAQHFRDRDPDAHGFRTFSLSDGSGPAFGLGGVGTAAALDGERVAVVEEPVAYHDEVSEAQSDSEDGNDGSGARERRGSYRLHVRPIR
jgi:outer membrane protein assembly factor BamB